MSEAREMPVSFVLDRLEDRVAYLASLACESDVAPREDISIIRKHCDQLRADKAELVEALDELLGELDSTPEIDTESWGIGLNNQRAALNKHKESSDA